MRFHSVFFNCGWAASLISFGRKSPKSSRRNMPVDTFKRGSPPSSDPNELSPWNMRGKLWSSHQIMTVGDFVCIFLLLFVMWKMRNGWKFFSLKKSDSLLYVESKRSSASTSKSTVFFVAQTKRSENEKKRDVDEEINFYHRMTCVFFAPVSHIYFSNSSREKRF